MSEPGRMRWRAPGFNFWLALFLLGEIIAAALFATSYLFAFLVIWGLYALPIIIRDWPFICEPATKGAADE